MGAAVLVEVSYAVVTRAWLAHWGTPVASELAITAARLVTIPIHWALFRDVIRSRARRGAPTRDPLLVFGIALVVLAAAVPEQPPLKVSWRLALVWALTSIVVGAREELVYRGVLQNLLERRMGWISAIVVSNVIFVVYHYRKFDFTAVRVATILLVGGALGLLYYRTGSLRLPIAVHTAYDTVVVLQLLAPSFLGPPLATLLQLAGVVLLAGWVRRTTPGASGAGARHL